MAKLTSLEDLGNLLPNDPGNEKAGAASPAARTGYNGKPQKLEVALDSKRRRGKTVTLVKGFQSRPDELESITGELKRMCGAGGRVLDNEIELQGDHREKVVEKLKKMGFTVKMR